MHVKESAILLGAKSTRNARAFEVTLYDASEPDRDGETIDVSTVRARGPIPLQIDHDRSVLATVGTVTGIRAEGKLVRGLLTFAPEGVSEIADQVFRQVAAGVTMAVSISFLGKETRREGRTCWTDVEVIELSFVAVGSSPGARVDRKALEQWLQSSRRSGDDTVLELADDINDGAVLEIADEDATAASRSHLAAQIRAAALAGLQGRGLDVGDPIGDPAARSQVADLMRGAIREAVNDIIRETTASALARARGRVD